MTSLTSLSNTETNNWTTKLIPQLKFTECTQILGRSEIKNESEKEKKIELIGHYVCGEHFHQLQLVCLCHEADAVPFAFHSPPFLKPRGLLIPSLLLQLLNLLSVFYAVIFTCTKRYCKPIYGYVQHHFLHVIILQSLVTFPL